MTKHATTFLLLLLCATLLPPPVAATTAADDAAAPVEAAVGSEEGCLRTLMPSDALLPPADEPVGVLVPCPGIRPGAVVRGAGGGCTLNFVFTGTSRDADGEPEEATYIGTAGHCIVDSGEEEVWAHGEGPEVTDHANRRFGEAVYATHADGFDFAILRVDDERADEVIPALCHFGGPSGMTATASADVGEVLRHFGQGMVYGDTIPGRSGAMLDEWGANRLAFKGAAIFGDSGSPLITADGDALGVVVAIIVVAPTIVIAAELEPNLDKAAAALDTEFELVTAALG